MKECSNFCVPDSNKHGHINTDWDRERTKISSIFRLFDFSGFNAPYIVNNIDSPACCSAIQRPGIQKGWSDFSEQLDHHALHLHCVGLMCIELGSISEDTSICHLFSTEGKAHLKQWNQICAWANKNNLTVA